MKSAGGQHVFVMISFLKCRFIKWLLRGRSKRRSIEGPSSFARLSNWSSGEGRSCSQRQPARDSHHGLVATRRDSTRHGRIPLSVHVDRSSSRRAQEENEVLIMCSKIRLRKRNTARSGTRVTRCLSLPITHTFLSQRAIGGAFM